MNQLTNIRLASNNDLTAISAIECSSEVFSWSLNTLRESIQHSNYHCWVIEENNAIKGYGIIRINPDTIEILKLCIHPQVRRKGLAKRLLSCILYSIKQYNIIKVLLEVRESNIAAINLYQLYGFKVLSKRQNYYSLPQGKRENALIMAYNSIY